MFSFDSLRPDVRGWLARQDAYSVLCTLSSLTSHHTLVHSSSPVTVPWPMLCAVYASPRKTAGLHTTHTHTIRTFPTMVIGQCYGFVEKNPTATALKPSNGPLGPGSEHVGHASSEQRQQLAICWPRSMHCSTPCSALVLTQQTTGCASNTKPYTEVAQLH